MLRIRVVLLALGLLAVAPGSAHSATIEVSYRVGGFMVWGFHDADVGGTATILYSDRTASGARTAQLQTFSVDARFRNVLFSYPYVAFLDGTVPLMLQPVAPGLLTPGGLLSLPILAAGQGTLTGYYCMYSTSCFPLSPRISVTLDHVFEFTNALASTFTDYPTLVARLRFREVSRTIPEPGTGLMLSGALLLALGGGAAIGRRFRR